MKSQSTQYIIKVTYLEGTRKGESYFLDKDGYVIDHIDYVWKDSTYSTESRCKCACTRRENINNQEAMLEKDARAKRIAKGKQVSVYPIYVLSKYEPYAVECVNMQ